MSGVAELYRTERTAPRLYGWDDIDSAALAAFAEQGFLVLERAISPADVAAASADIDAVLTRPETRRCVQFEPVAGRDLHAADLATKRAWVRKLMHFVDQAPELARIAADPRLLAFLERVMGEPPRLFQDMALLKPAGVGSEKPWHQDNAYFNIPPETPVVGAWIALDEATPENGCMHVVPGSHRAGPIVHFQRRDWQICDTDVATREVVAVPLKPGGALLFFGLLHHGTPPNQSDRPRRALQFHYAPASCPSIPQEARMAVFGAEGKDVEC